MTRLIKKAFTVLVLTACNVCLASDEYILDAADSVVAELIKLLNSDLIRRTSGRDFTESEFEEILQKITKLGPAAVGPLSFKLEQDSKRLIEAEVKLDELKFDTDEFYTQLEKWSRLQEQGNLELLTALRRVQKKPDPISIEVTLPKDLKVFPGRMPSLSIKLKSADVEKNPIWINLRPTYFATRRQAKFRFEVRSADGVILKTILNPSLERHFGGLRCDGWLEFGGQFDTVLYMGDFTNIQTPGEYTVTLLYHARLPIADIEDETKLEKLIVFRSEPFKLVVEKPHKRRIQLSQADREKVMSLVEALPNDGFVQIVGGVYDEDDYEFVSPKYEPGKILTLHWTAVPTMIDSLSGEILSLHQKAWVLSLLFTITGERDLNPIDFPGALPKYEGRMGQTSLGAHFSDQCRIDPDQQKALIAKWLQFRDDWVQVVDE